MKSRVMLLFGILLMAGSATAKPVVYSDYLVNETGLGVDTNYDLDLKARGIDSVAAVVTASSGTYAVASFTGGRAATGTFTVASLSGLTTAYATNKLTVLSTNSLTGAQIRLAGIPITEGVDWAVGATKAATALNIAAALNTKFSGIIASTAPTGSAVVYSTATAAGTAANSYSYSSSNSSITVNASAFSGGADNAFIEIDGTKLTFNVDIGIGGTTAATATNIATAINANPTLASKVVATAASTVVRTTATVVGTAGNYGLVSSSPSAVTASGLAMTAGTNATTSINSSLITVASHGLSTGMGVTFSTSSGVGLSPLAPSTVYYVIKVDANTLKLATSKANAVAGTAITITSSSTLTSAPSYSLTVPTISGTPSYKWKASNDGTYWVDLSTRTNTTGVAVEQISMSAYTYGGASQAWNFGPVGYRYLRFAVTAPTAGAIWIKNYVVGKQD